MNLLDQLQPLLQSIPRNDDQAVAIVDMFLRQASKRGASDIHLECKRDILLVKFRLDGRLHLAARLDRNLKNSLLTRLKVMAGLVIYQTRSPQDGRIEYTCDEKAIQCRLAFLPTLHGEKVVIRLPETRQATLKLADLGMNAQLLRRIEAILHYNQGIILLTGPSSSGKTTTIYAMLKAIYRLRGEAANIVTLEDPIEADLGVVSQTQVSEKQGMTFEQGLRTLLRQDPEVIMIGEIRDSTTADIAIQAGLTGHLVISTIHSGRASGVFARLLNMGIEPFLVASALSAVVAQRLVRRLCPACRVRRSIADSPPPPPELLGAIEEWWEPVGCPECEGTGYRGRVGIFEMLEVDDGLRHLILDRAPENSIRSLIERPDAWNLARDAAGKVAAGITSPQEALMVVR